MAKKDEGKTPTQCWKCNYVWDELDSVLLGDSVICPECGTDLKNDVHENY